jgi:hypothetical protein
MWDGWIILFKKNYFEINSQGNFCHHAYDQTSSLNNPFSHNVNGRNIFQLEHRAQCKPNAIYIIVIMSKFHSQLCVCSACFVFCACVNEMNTGFSLQLRPHKLRRKQLSITDTAEDHSVKCNFCFTNARLHNTCFVHLTWLQALRTK